MDLPLILIGVLAAGGLLIPTYDLLLKGSDNRRLAGVTALVALFLSIGIVLFPVLVPGVELTSSTAMFRTDFLGIFFSVAVLMVVVLVAVASLEYQRNDPNAGVYYSLLLFTALGMVLLAFAVDLLMIFVAWQLMSIPTFILTGFKKRDRQSNEAAVKFFILGALSSGILLYGISLVFGLTGSTNLDDVVTSFGGLPAELQPMAFLAIATMIAGFGLKMAIVPFHMWLPDALEGAPTPVSALLSAGTKKAGFVAALRVFIIAMAAFRLDISLIIALLAILTMTLGNVAALTQKSVTRLLAYSSIAHAGYILIGLAAATQIGLVGLLYHVFAHAVMTSAAFIAIAAVVHGGLQPKVGSLNGLGRIMPITAFTLMISLLALAGVPPLNGFWSKLFLFTAALEVDMAWLAVAGVINSAFSLGYYGWLIKRMYLDSPENGNYKKVPEHRTFTGVLVASTIIIILTGIYPSAIFEFASRAVLGL